VEVHSAVYDVSGGTQCSVRCQWRYTVQCTVLVEVHSAVYGAIGGKQCSVRC